MREVTWGIPVPDTGNFPPMATNLKVLQGPLFGEGDLGDSDLCLFGGRASNSLKTVGRGWGVGSGCCSHSMGEVANAYSI